ncbi:MAG TPA: SCO family protein [Devosiaceae bacterium]|jgi:protein SCO1/2|nr:SCO family protein [Devosiaceae bacterium]
MANTSPSTKKPSSGLALFRIILWTLVVVVGGAAAALYFWKPPAPTVGLTGAPFTLQSTAGGEFTQADLKGTPTLMFFGYTYCPDVCPTTLAELTSLRQQMKLSPDQLRIVFATVDPDRDTIPQLKNYLSAFGSPIIGLTGTQAQVDAVKTAFGVYSKKGPDDGTNTYLVDHTATVFLLGRQGEFEGTVAYGEDQKSEAAKLKRLVGT